MKKDNLKVLILIGLPASGKSTWCGQFLRKNPGYLRVNRDDLREMFRNDGVCDPTVEKLISEIQDKAILHALVKKMNVIVDNTNLKESRIKHITELVADYADVEYMLFDAPPKTCIERDGTRKKQVGGGYHKGHVRRL